MLCGFSTIKEALSRKILLIKKCDTHPTNCIDPALVT